MKITPLQNQNFYGHGAGKIKALYMQNPNLPSQIPVYNELKNIGKVHDFDVFIQGENEILDAPFMKYPSAQHCNYQIWSQDNKTFLNKNGKTVLISGLYMPETEQMATCNLAQLKKIKHEQPELFLEGGNFFVGKKLTGKTI